MPATDLFAFIDLNLCFVRFPNPLDERLKPIAFS
jgi:hypothetical protein